MSPDPATALQRQPLLRVPVPWVFVLAYLAGAGLQLLLPVRAGSSTLIRIVGMIVFGVGGVLAAWCLFLFRRASTTTTPGETSSAFVTRGPYRVSRNPMYVSLTLL